ncbi:TRAP transporter large permease [Aeoliella mucimassa]|uniref:Sialic acid TRAP transporter permease protein SiaT n=1 Tax=Aeoliella mucimassa TaxID=2527972 RepID=A0A518AMD3_9BACT|nr:TRAP transporter large permease [Aeoliella mucimassa]QDU55889.1 Sialic acid TRAP transporter permease protein SiaT [Aeoliella mucimassa]
MDAQLLILIASFVLLLVLDVPIAVCLGVAAVLSLQSAIGDMASTVVAQRMTNGVASFPLLAIPSFIVAGRLMAEGGMAGRLIDFAACLLGRSTAALAYVCTLSCMLFGAISGSATAAVSGVGGMVLPEMWRKGYSRPFSVALTTVSATTGLVIPPSNIMIVYAVVAGNVSVAAMFLAGVLPGILLGLSIIATSWWCMPELEVAADDQDAESEPESIELPLVKTTLRALPSLLLIIIVLAGILQGIFSATEAAAIAVLYAFVLAVFVYREVPFTALPKILLGSGVTTAVIFFLIAASQALSWVLALESIPQMVSEGLMNLTDNYFLLLLLINLTLLVVGTFMDMTPAVLIFAPIFLPIVTSLGIHPVHFGIIMIVNLCIGLCTPPVGTCLFVGCGVGGTKIVDLIRPLIPYLLAMVIALMVITYWPELSLWLPRLAGQME